MKLLEVNVGDDAWCYVSGHSGERTKCKVVHTFKLDSWHCPHYVLEYETHIDPILVVRDGFTLSDAEDKEIGLWRKDK